MRDIIVVIGNVPVKKFAFLCAKLRERRPTVVTLPAVDHGGEGIELVAPHEACVMSWLDMFGVWFGRLDSRIQSGAGRVYAVVVGDDPELFDLRMRIAEEGGVTGFDCDVEALSGLDDMSVDPLEEELAEEDQGEAYWGEFWPLVLENRATRWSRIYPDPDVIVGLAKASLFYDGLPVYVLGQDGDMQLYKGRRREDR